MPRLLEHRYEHVPRRPWVRRAFQDHELPRTQRRRNRTPRIFDIRQVWIATFIQRRRNTNQNRIGLTQTTHVRRRGKAFGSLPGANFFGGNMRDVAFTALQLLNLALVDIEPQRRHPDVRERFDQGQADISEAHNADEGRAIFDRPLQLLGGILLYGGHELRRLKVNSLIVLLEPRPWFRRFQPRPDRRSIIVSRGPSRY
jgi:hypothetical protein